MALLVFPLKLLELMSELEGYLKEIPSSSGSSAIGTGEPSVIGMGSVSAHDHLHAAPFPNGELTIERIYYCTLPGTQPCLSLRHGYQSSLNFARPNFLSLRLLRLLRCSQCLHSFSRCQESLAHVVACVIHRVYEPPRVGSL